MNRLLLAIVLLLLGCTACGLMSGAKGTPEQTFIVYSSDTIGELKPCG